MHHLRTAAFSAMLLAASTGLAFAQATPKAGGDPMNDRSGAGATGVGGAATVRPTTGDTARGAGAVSGGTSSGTGTIGGSSDRPISSGVGAPSTAGGTKPPASPTGHSNGNTGTGSGAPTGGAPAR